MSTLVRIFRDPSRLNKLDKLFSVLACSAAIFMTAWLARWQANDGPLLLASMGASVAILFAIHGSPLAQPWSLLGGHFSSGLVGVLLAYAVDDTLVAAALTAGLSVLVMSLLRCLHPPGVATALVPVLNYPHVGQPNFQFLLTPLALNVSALLLLTLLINRLLLRRQYPALPPKSAGRQQAARTSMAKPLTVDRDEIEQALRDFGQFVDVGVDELRQLFSRVQLRRLQNRFPDLTCGDIMQTHVATLEYASEVEAAWCLMHERNLKVLPVLDRSRRVIGIVTLYDFLKNLQMKPYADFHEKWRNFIRRTPAASTNKPEAVGHIMTRKVATVAASAHFGELIPLLVEQGHRHVPVVDHEQRFVGLVAQSDLIGAMLESQSRSGTFAFDASQALRTDGH